MYSNVFKTSEGAKKAWLTRGKGQGKHQGLAPKTKPASGDDDFVPAPTKEVSKIPHTLVSAPKVSHPINAQSGLHMQVKFPKGTAPADKKAVAAHYADKHGYDPKGKSQWGFSTVINGNETFSIWHHTKKEDTMSYAHIFKAASGCADGPKPTPFTKAKENKKTGKNLSVTLDHKNTGVDDPHRQPKKMSPGTSQAKKSDMAIMQGRIARDLGLL